MRTTVTLDEDVEKLLRDEMHRSRRSFTQALNVAVRKGLGGATKQARPEPFVLEARPMGLRAGIDPAGLNRLADDLEAEAFLERQARLPRS